MGDRGAGLIEVGGLAERLGASPSTVRQWEGKGWIPAAMRLESGRRVWRLTDLPTIREGLEERRARRERSPLDAA